MTTIEPTLSVVITAHAESILLHHTLASIRRALIQLKNKYSYEIILHIDNATPQMESYVQNHIDTTLKDARIFKNKFGDLGASRNYAIKEAVGKYVSIIDADDLMSESWLISALNYLEKQIEPTVAHTEMTVEFEDAHAIIKKYGEINKVTDTLLSVWSGRWNSVIITSRKILLEHPYPTNDPGYGYEDWSLSCSFIYNNIHNILIPNTVIFVRRKLTGSEWARQKTSRSVLHSHPLLSFDNFRQLPSNDTKDSGLTPPSTSLASKLKLAAKPLANKLPYGKRSIKRGYRLLRSAYHNLNNRSTVTDVKKQTPQWLIDEWTSIHSIEKELFPSQNLLNSITTYHTITPDHWWVGEAYKRMVDHTTLNNYDYILLVPWLIKGGADLFAINYANEIAVIDKNKHVLVIATNNNQSIWQSRLSETVDFIPFGEIAGNLPEDHQFRLLEQLVENSHAPILHVLNSALGYDFLMTHQAYLKGSNKKVAITSFSQSSDSSGYVFGFSHTHVPKVYDLADVITTDNQAVADMWIDEYGFDPEKILVHRQPVTLDKKFVVKKNKKDDSIKLLWAARLAPEKQPEILVRIGKLLEDDPTITIDMYGEKDDGFNTSFLADLPNNITYKGAFDGFFSLPLGQYDAYLYTTLFDGMPNAILEAAQASLPIISSRIGGIPEFVVDGETGILVDDVKNAEAYVIAIKKLHLDSLRNKLSRNSLEKLQKNYSLKSYTNNLRGMLDRLDY